MEGVITEKQVKTLKFVRGWLLADFIVLILAVALVAFIGVIAAVVFSAAASFFKTADMPQMKQIMPEVGILLIILIAFGIALTFLFILLGSLLFNKKPNRKKAVSAAMLVYTSIIAALAVFNLVMSILNSPAMNPGYDLYKYMLPEFSAVYSQYGIPSILGFAYSAISLFFAIVLFRKTRGMPNRAFPYKLLFILYVVFIYAGQYASMFFLPSSTYRDAGSIIASCITMGFFTFMYLFPMIAVFKAMDDEAFYENFMVINPGICISRYETANWKNVTLEQMRFCMHCGTPLTPMAIYCRQCGRLAGRR